MAGAAAGCGAVVKSSPSTSNGMSAIEVVPSDVVLVPRTPNTADSIPLAGTLISAVSSARYMSAPSADGSPTTTPVPVVAAWVAASAPRSQTSPSSVSTTAQVSPAAVTAGADRPSATSGSRPRTAEAPMSYLSTEPSARE